MSEKILDEIIEKHEIAVKHMADGIKQFRIEIEEAENKLNELRFIRSIIIDYNR